MRVGVGTRWSGWTFVAVLGCGFSCAAGQSVPHMAAAAEPSYEVATIKPSDPAGESSGFQTRGRRVIVLNETLDSMLVFAYGLQKKQVIGGPAWFETDHYDISGVPDLDGEPNLKQFQGMLRKLLTDRFHLQFHREQREMSIYALRVEKGMPKLVKSKSDPESMPDQTGNGGSVNDWRFTNNSMENFASFLQFILDRPVIDQTTLTGKYDFRLKWASDALKAGDTEGVPGLLTAMPEQIGVKLEATKGPAEALVVDRVERPSAN